jgi:hypothetical protein
MLRTLPKTAHLAVVRFSYIDVTATSSLVIYWTCTSLQQLSSESSQTVIEQQTGRLDAVV